MKIKVSDMVKAAILTAISIVLARFASIVVPIAGFSALRIGFSLLPIMFSGILFGPVVGGLTGALADFIGAMLFPIGPYHPGLTLTAALNGVIAGFLFNEIKIYKSRINFNYINAVIIILIGAIYIMGRKIPDEVGIKTILQIGGIFVVTIVYAILPAIMTRYIKRKDGIQNGRLGFDKVAFMVSINYVINSVFLNTYFLAQLFDKGFMVMLPGRLFAGLVMVPLNSLLIYMLVRYTTKIGENE